MSGLVYINRGTDEAERLERVIEQNRSLRMQTAVSYSDSESTEIRDYRYRLFPQDWELSREETDDFRALCAFSQVTLKPPAEIRSHRPVVGPVIVFVKKLLWPFARLYLKDTLAGVQAFHTASVVRHAKAVVARRDRGLE